VSRIACIGCEEYGEASAHLEAWLRREREESHGKGILAVRCYVLEA
jgi:hypothetical protein